MVNVTQGSKRCHLFILSLDPTGVESPFGTWSSNNVNTVVDNGIYIPMLLETHLFYFMSYETQYNT